MTHGPPDNRFFITLERRAAHRSHAVVLAPSRHLVVRGGAITRFLRMSRSSNDRYLARLPLAVLAISTLWSLPLACTNSRDANSSRMRDVRDESPPVDARLALAPRPTTVLRYDEETGLGPLDAVGAVHLSDGRIVVASAQSIRLEFYSGSGTLVRTVGRRGRGPGEFGALAALWRTRGDSLITFEGGMTRTFSIFDSAGRFARSWTTIGADSSLRFLIPLAVLPDGRMAARTMNVITPFPVARTTRPSTWFLLFDSDWSTHQVVHRMPDTYRYQGPGDLQSELPFSPEPLAAFSTDVAYFANSDSALVHRINLTTRSSAVLRWDDAPRTITALDIDRELARRIEEARIRYSNVPALQRRFIDGALRPLFQRMPIPPFFPLIGRLLTDSEELLWVLSYVAPADRAVTPQTARVFDSTGHMIGEVAFPAGFAPTDIGHDFVLGIRTSSDSVTSVESYPLMRRASQ